MNKGIESKKMKEYVRRIKADPSIGGNPEDAEMSPMTTDRNFFGHSKVTQQNIVKNPPSQIPQLGKDGFYANVQNKTGKN